MAFLRQEKPKQFKYIPMYYDEAKEDLQNRIKAVDNKLEQEKTGDYRPSFKGKFRERHDALYGESAKPRGRSISKWFMLIIYAVLVVAIIYLVLNILTQVS